jgi:thiosulfate reductase/polysulfide reductase chain A
MKRREFIRLGSLGVAAAALYGGQRAGQLQAYAHPVPDPGTDGDHVVPSFCELCFWKCGILAHVKDGRVTKIVGNPRDPLSNGRLCPRGTGGTGLLYDPDRLERPMIRRDARGGARFEEVSWDAALDRVAEGMESIRKRHGVEALALFAHGYGGSWFEHLFKAYGSPNITHPSYAQCRGPRDAGFELTFGAGVGSPEITDMASARCIVLVGSHLGENMHNTQVQEFAEALRNGAELIVVDPRYSTAAGKTRHWLPIRPGADLSLLLAWMNVIVTERLYDRAYLEAHAYGFEQLEAHVQPYTPEWAHPRTGIDPAVIRRTAHLMAGARPATVVHPGRHVTWYGNDTQRSRAIAILNALLGTWGRQGGLYSSVQMDVMPYPKPAYPTPTSPIRDRDDARLYPLGHELAQGIRDASLARDGKAPGIRGWMVYGSNLPTTLPDPRATYAAIQQLELLVSVDVLPMEIVGWSDVVLPESTYLERWDDLNAPAYREPFVQLRQPAVEPLHDSKPGSWIAKELGARLGLASFFPWADARSYVEARVRATGLDWERLRREGTLRGAPQPIYFEEGAAPQFDTDSGKIELYSPKLATLGFDPIPTWHEGEVEDPPAGYYRLLSGRAPTHTFGRTSNNRLLAEQFPENAVWVNATVAAKWRLADGERVYLENQDGVRSTFSAPVKVTERIHPEAVYLVHGWGHRAKGLGFAHGRGIDDAELITRYKVDPIMGGTGMNVNFVTFRRASEVDGEGAKGGAA